MLLVCAGTVAICFASCSDDPPAPATKSVTVEAQQNIPVEGTAGSAAYSVVTENIADGEAGNVAWFSDVAGTTAANAPAGVTATISEVSDNAATATVATTTGTPAGTWYFKVIISETESDAVAFTVDEAPVKSVTVGAQQGWPVAGTPGAATFGVTTENIADGRTGTVAWFSDAAGTTAANAPAGVQANVANVSGNASSVTVSTTAATPAKTCYFKVTIDGTTSAVASFEVSATPVRIIMVGAQQGSLTTGTPGAATFGVITENIADGEEGRIVWFSDASGEAATGTPAGITAEVSGLSDNAATVIVKTTEAAAAKSYYFKVSIAETISAVATLTVDPIAVSGPSMTMVSTKSGQAAITLGGTGGARVDWGVAGVEPTTITLTGDTAADLKRFSHTYSNTAARTITVTGENITYMDCSGNSVTSLSANANTTLKTLSCNNNSLTSLSVSGMNGLTSIGGKDNSMDAAALNVTISTFPQGSGRAFYFNGNPGFSQLTYYDIERATDKGWTIHDYIAVTGITLNKTSITLAPGQSEQLTATILPADATNKSVMWGARWDEGITVSNTGLVTALELPDRYNDFAEAGANGGNNLWTVCEVTIPQPGTETNPFRVATAADLQKVGTGTGGWTLSAHYRQTANIDISGIANWTPIGIDSGNSFTGSYDGGGYFVIGLKTSGSEYNKGLFGVLGSGGAVKNLGVIIISTGSASPVSGLGNVGGIAGVNWGTVNNCYVSGPNSLNFGGVRGTSASVGGIVGNNHGMIRDCYSTCTVFGENNVGGIAGLQASDGTVENCYSTSYVTGNLAVGGIVGNSGGVVRRCVALNPMLYRLSTGNYGTRESIGCVVGADSGTLDSNWSRLGMPLFVKVSLPIGDGEQTFSGSSNPNGRDGTVLPAVNFPVIASFWSGSVQLSAANWSLADGRLPYLANFNHTQNPTLPAIPQ